MARTLVAVNTAPDSENQMHGEEARRFGFTGGLVPGVDVLGYLAHEGVARWGAAWLGGGRFTGRLIAPVYDGETVRVEADDPDGADDAQLVARVLGADDDVRAEATMSRLPAAGSGEERNEPDRPAVLRRADPVGAPIAPLPDPGDRHPASRESLRAGTPTATMRSGFHAEHARHYLQQISETHPVFCEDGMAQPAWLLTLANFTLASTVRLGPWIHVGSDLWMLAPVRDGDEIEVRGVVTDRYERKGHEFVDLQVWYLREGAPVALADHRAIWRPRAGAEGS